MWVGRLFWVRSCFLINLIKSVKGHKSLGLLFNVKNKKWLSDQWVISDQWVSDKVTYWAVCGQLKKDNICRMVLLIPQVQPALVDGHWTTDNHRGIFYLEEIAFPRTYTGQSVYVVVSNVYRFRRYLLSLLEKVFAANPVCHKATNKNKGGLM